VQLSDPDSKLSKSCFTEVSIQEAVRFHDLPWFELWHGVPKLVGTPINDRQLLWSAYGILSSPENLKTFTKLVDDAIKDAKWNYNIICTTSLCGLPVAALLSVENDVKLLSADNMTYRLLPREIDAGERVLMVDSRLGTGSHVNIIKASIEKRGGNFIGLVTIVIDDMVPERLPLIENLLNENKIIFLHKTSEYYDRWRKTKE